MFSKELPQLWWPKSFLKVRRIPVVKTRLIIPTTGSQTGALIHVNKHSRGLS
jgi:hypothetical protein